MARYLLKVTFMNLKSLVSLTLATAFLLIAASRADATLVIALQEAGVNGGAVTVVGMAADFTSVSFSGVYGDFSVVIDGGSSSNGTALSSLLGSANSVTNNAGSNRTLNLWVTQTNYSLPVGTPLFVEAGMSGTINTGTINLAGVFQPWGDNANAAFGMGQTPGPISAAQNGSTFDTGSLTGLFNRTSINSLFSLTSMSRLDLSGGGNVNFSSHVNLTAVPEPVSLVMLGSGLLGLAGAAKRRALKCAGQ